MSSPRCTSISRASSSALVAVLVVAAACGGDDLKLARHLETSASWLAAIDMTTRSYVSNRVPVRFARQLVDEGRSRLDAATKAVRQLRSDNTDQAAAGDALEDATQAVDAMVTALEQRDRRAVLAALPPINAYHAILDSLTDRAKAMSQ